MKSFTYNIKEAEFYLQRDDSSVDCILCSQYCNISTSKSGICSVRYNENGKLYSMNYGYIQGLTIDPIEKKPFFHFMPGTKVLSFGTPGCNFSCLNCQNDSLSQSVKKDKAILTAINFTPPEKIVELAKQYNISGIAYTYSEPTIFFEYSKDIINLCKSDSSTRHLKHLFISNGFFSKDLIKYIIEKGLIDAVNIDLKFMNEGKYKKITGGALQPVLENITTIIHNSDIHLEIINLVIPGENDTIEDFTNISEFVANLDDRIPLHFSRFYPQYKMSEYKPTPEAKLLEARVIALKSGLKYVYTGNIRHPGGENSFCYNCNHILVERNNYSIIRNSLIIEENKTYCPVCGFKQYFII